MGRDAESFSKAVLSSWETPNFANGDGILNMNNAWTSLGSEFTWDEAKRQGITQGTLTRTIDHAKSLGILVKDGNRYQKVNGATTSNNNTGSGTP